MVGELHLIVGPMFSGKTTSLLSKIVLMADVGRKCLYVNYRWDNRVDCQTDGTVSTHHSRFASLPSTITSRKVMTLSELSVDDFQVIGVDEAQFFPDIGLITSWVASGKIVYVSALDGDYKRRPFDGVLSLIPECDSIVKQVAYCRPCLDRGLYVQAPFTRRIALSGERILIGGSESYIPVCRGCLTE